MATTLFIISAVCFYISNGIDTYVSHSRKDVLSPMYRPINAYLMMYETVFLEKAIPIISVISIWMLMPTSISMAFHLNWFLAFLIVLLLKVIVQGVLVTMVNFVIVFFARGKFFSSMIITFIVGIITLVIGILIR